MRNLLVLLTVLAVLAAACGDRADDPDAEALAGQADRIAELLDEGEDCRALEAARALGTMAEEASLDQEVRSAAATYADQARQQLTCEAPTTPPAPEPDPEPEPQDEGEGENERKPGGNERDRGNDDGPPGREGDEGPGNGQGEGPDDDKKDDDDSDDD